MDFGSRKKLVKMLVGYLNEITGPKAKFILILCATSGMVEKAINPGRIGDKTISWKLYILMQNFNNGTEWDPVLSSFVFPTAPILEMNWKGSLSYSAKMIQLKFLLILSPYFFWYCSEPLNTFRGNGGSWRVKDDLVNCRNSTYAHICMLVVLNSKMLGESQYC